MSERQGNWEEATLGDVAEVINGRAYKLSEWETSGTPVIRLQNLTQRGGDFYFSNLALPEKQYCHKGDLLYMWSATFGPHIWWGEKAIFHYHIWKIEPNERIDKKFLFYLLDAKTQEWKAAGSGMAMIHLTKAGIEKEPLDIPPLPEQKKIAEILSGIDEQLSNLVKKEQHCLQTLNAIALDAFADSSTNTTTLGELAVFHGGRAFKSGELTESGMKVTRISNLHKPDFPYWRYNGQFNQKILAKDGDILFSWAGVANSINVHRYKGEDTLLNQHIYNFKFENELIKEWTYWALKNMLPSLRKQIEGGAGQLHLTKGFIQAIEIPITDSEKMSALCASFRSAESLVTFLRSKQRKLNFLKSALCGDLLSGRKRVSV